MKSSFSWPGRPPAEMISKNVNRLLTSILGGTPKRGAFYTSILDGSQKGGAFCTSYLVGTPKRGAFCTSYLVGTPKRGAFCTSYLVGAPKRGAFCTSYLVGTPKRGAFCTSYLIGSLRRGVFCLFYSSFLALMQEKKQKKIKASGMPAKSASSFSIVVFSSSIFLCLNSLFSSGKSSSRCSVMCAP